MSYVSRSFGYACGIGYFRTVYLSTGKRLCWQIIIPVNKLINGKIYSNLSPKHAIFRRT
jgi:hypothetical protein